MSTGKRLAKRSIVGTKVVVLGEDGLYYPGVIQAVKTAEIDQGVATGGNRANAMPITKYAVRIDINRQLHEYSEVDLIGPGFQNTSGITLKAGQRVYVTFAGREVAGHVTKHRPDVDEVHVTLQGSNSVRLRSGLSHFSPFPMLSGAARAFPTLLLARPPLFFFVSLGCAVASCATSAVQCHSTSPGRQARGKKTFGERERPRISRPAG